MLRRLTSISRPKAKGRAAPIQKEVEALNSSTQILSLAQEAAAAGLIPRDIVDHIISLKPQVPNSMKLRYLLTHIHNEMKEKEDVFLSMVQVFLKHQFEYKMQAKSCLATNNIMPKPDVSTGDATNMPDSEELLTPDHIPDLIELLIDYSSQWRSIGTALRFLPQELDNIEVSPSLIVRAPKSYLQRILEDWLQGKCKNTCPPTKGSLEKALSSRTVGLGIVADKVRAYTMSSTFHNFSASKVNDPDPPYLEIQVSLENDGLMDSEGEMDQVKLVMRCSMNIHSEDLFVEEGSSILLDVKPISDIKASFSYEWLKNGQPLQSSKEYSLAGPILCITKADIDMEGSKFSCRVTANSPEHSISIETDPVTLTVSCPLDKCRYDLNPMYMSQPEIPEDTWPPVSSKKYINLALIKQDRVNFGAEYARLTIRGDMDDILQHKEEVDCEEVISGLRSRQVLFIEGRPGSGKTTFVNKITHGWASGSYKGLKLVLLVSLRVLNNLRKRHLGLSDILKLFKDMKIDKELVEKRNGKGFCFIFDGLDEFSPRDGRDSIVFKIIRKEYLSESTVIVASRPAAIAHLRGRANKVIEVLGFKEEQILEYFKHYPFSSTQKLQELKEYLSTHPNILHMCYLPIHAAMVGFLFEVTGEVPQTETEIYKLFTRFTLMRSLTKNREVQLENVDMDKLSGEDEKLFRQICRLALDKTVLNKQVLQHDEVKSYFETDKDKDISLGLITVDCTASLYGFEDIYTFLHLTFQEYLAACYISTLSGEEQMKLIEQLADKNHMLVVWKFYCGLVKFSSCEQKFRRIIAKNKGQSLFQFQCAYESQQQIACDQVLKTSNGLVEISDTCLTAPDFMALGFVMGKPLVPMHVAFSNCNVNIDAIDSFSDPDIVRVTLQHLDTTPASLGHILKFCRNSESLVLTNSICETEKIHSLNTSLKHFTNLVDLDVSKNGLGDEGAKLLAQGLKFCSNLVKIKLTDNGIAAAGFEAVFTSLRHCSLRVKSDSILHGNLVSEETLIDCLKHCTQLQSLHATATDNLMITFQRSSKHWRELKQLSLTSAVLSKSTDIGQAVAQSLPHFKSLESLILKNCKINRIGTVALAESLQNCSELRLLNLSSNSIDYYGAMLIFESSLQKHSDLLRLNLSVNKLGDNGAKALVAHQVASVCLQKLDLSENGIGNKGAKAIAQSLTACKANLRILKLHVNKIGDDGAISLANLLKNCDNFQELHLGVNLIGGSGVKALASSLSHCNSLKKFDLHHNPIDIKSAEAIMCILKHHGDIVDLSDRRKFIQGS